MNTKQFIELRIRDLIESKDNQFLDSSKFATDMSIKELKSVLRFIKAQEEFLKKQEKEKK